MAGFDRFIVVLVFLFVLRVSCTNYSYYSSYYGTELTSDQVAQYQSNGTLENCTNIVVNCSSTEPRRINGTCNNLKYPSRGATRTPYYRLLNATFNQTSSTVFDPRLSVCTGGALPGCRDLRRTLLSDGRVSDTKLTQGVTHMSVFFVTDITNTKDTTNYVSWRPFCCEAAGAKDYMCAPNVVPDDDYVHRFSGIKCLNMTRPLTFQTSGCLANTTKPLRIVDATPTFDMSPIYGNVDEPARRNYTNGTLKTETIDGCIFPPSSGINLLLGVNFIGIIYFWRWHNHICDNIAAVNPCLTDDEIFAIAREINIAFGNQIWFYELMGTMMGTDNLIDDGVLMDTSNSTTQFRDIYDDTFVPQISIEFPTVMRWMHKIQDGELQLFSVNGTYLNQSFPMVNLTSNLNFIKQNATMKSVSQGCFRQGCGKVDDNIVDPDLVNLGLGGLQRSNDILTNDLSKSRHYGIPPYVSYRSKYYGDNITSFDDLCGIISEEGVEALKSKYSCVEDIDLLAGVWMEELLEGTYVPPTFYSIVRDQLLHNIKSDRHWYERDSRPNAFTEDQMAEIRKATMARMLCDVGDSVTEVQPRAFELPGSDNEIVSCDEIDDIDYSLWYDDTCAS